MVNINKRRGSDFERDIVTYLNDRINGGTFKRMAGSGALGTLMNEPALMGDIAGRVGFLPRQIRIECKAGYGGENQFVLKREWLDKIAMESSGTYSIPIIAGRFIKAKTGVTKFIVMDINTFVYLVNEANALKEELDKIYEKESGSDTLGLH